MTDIVERLRAFVAGEAMLAEEAIAEAADEIERLREQLAEATAEIDKLRELWENSPSAAR